MRTSILLIAISMSIWFASTSCSKSTETPTIVGFWVGTYQVTGFLTKYYISFDLRPDGTFLQKGTGADGNTYYGQGSYIVTGNNFNYSDTTLNLSQTGAVEIGSGSYTAAASMITGSWQNPGDTTVIGTFSLTKSQ